jgi:hypothetical protein
VVVEPEFRRSENPTFSTESAKSSHCVDTEWDAVGVLSNAGSNLSFTAKFETAKPMKTLMFSCFFVFRGSKKSCMGTSMGTAGAFYVLDR